jgi:hypothetical protein
MGQNRKSIIDKMNKLMDSLEIEAEYETPNSVEQRQINLPNNKNF